MSTFGAPAGGFGKAPAAPAAGGFGKAPATGGFGAPAAPAAGGFGAPAAPAAGGFGAPAAPAAGGFGAPAAPAAGGFGAPAAPAAGGFGAPAAGGFGAPAAPAAGGFGKAPAGGFGAPAAGGFGAPAAPAAGGFGKAPVAGGFGAPAAGGFGAPAATQPQVTYTGITGPGYTPPNTPNWMTGCDLTQITDDTLVSNLPQNLKQHIGTLLEFGAKERAARKDMQKMYQDLESESNPKGMRALQRRLEGLTSNVRRGIDSIVVDVLQREKIVKQLLVRVRATDDEIVRYQKDVWERIQKEGSDYWQFQNRQQHHREGLSVHMQAAVERIQSLMIDTDQALTELVQTLGGKPSADANGRTPAEAAVSGSGASSFPTISPRDGIALVQLTMQQVLQAFLTLGGAVSSLHSRTDQLRDHITRFYGESEAEQLFKEAADGERESLEGGSLAEDEENNIFLTLTIGDTMRGRRGQLHTMSGKQLGLPSSATSSMLQLPGARRGQRRTMHYDPQLESAMPGNTTVPPTAPAAGGFGAPAQSASGFGAPSTAAAAKGFGAPPAAGAGFGAPAAAPAAGFGAPAAATASKGFGAPAAGAAAASAPAPTVGFASGATPAPAAPLSNPQGLGATPAPVGGFGLAATPASGATPSAIINSVSGFSPLSAGANQGPSPSPVPAASPDERPKKGRR